jgi:TRAP-type C4-dicarboxylate transport system substrate-binding protein
LKDVKFCLAFVVQPGTFHSVSKRIQLPTDLSGTKVRPAQATVAAWAAGLGATNVQAAAPEVRDIVEKGVADVVAWPYGSLLQFGIDKFAKIHVDAPMFSTAFVLVLNKATYAKMSPAQRQVIDQHCNSEAAERIAKPWADYESAGEATLRSRQDQTFVSLTPEMLKQWQASSQPQVAKWKDQVRATGNDPDKVMGDLKSALAKVGAAY